MCGEKLKAVLRTNREIADKKNEEIFSKKRATMGDNEVVQSSASASASTSAVAGKAKIDSFPLFILWLTCYIIFFISPDTCSDCDIFYVLTVNYMSYLELL